MQCTSASAKLVDHEQPPGAAFSLHYEGDEDFMMAKKTVRPQRVPVTVANFVGINSFSGLESQKERKLKRKKQKVICLRRFQN